MKIYKANLYNNSNEKFFNFGFLFVNNNDEIEDVFYTTKNSYPIKNAKTLDGYLIPGIFNSHCHLELSFFEKKIKSKEGLASFIKEIVTTRNNFSIEEKMEKMEKWLKYQINSGVVFIADIMNDSFGIEIKKKYISLINFYNFIEIFCVKNEQINSKIKESKNILNQLINNNILNNSITPHSFYSLHKNLWKILEQELNNQSIISIHHLESSFEKDILYNKKNSFSSFLNFEGFEKNYIDDIISKWNKNTKKIYVHNTYMEQKELELLKDKNNYWCFCPKANLYIENKLPNFNLFIKNFSDNILIGTDSLASNDELNIFSELKTIQEYYPNISFFEMIKWITENPSKAFNVKNKLGSFEIGKKPGGILIQGVDKNGKIGNKLISKRIF